jgi:hypothetical protein
VRGRAAGVFAAQSLPAVPQWRDDDVENRKQDRYGCDLDGADAKRSRKQDQRQQRFRELVETEHLGAGPQRKPPFEELSRKYLVVMTES